MTRPRGTRSLQLVMLGGVVALAAIPAGPAAAAEPDRGGDRWAVLVGVDDYTLAAKLQFCGADQRALRERLVAAGFPERQVFLLDDKALEGRYRPSKGNIERQVTSVLRTAAEGDVVVFGFSGHGTEIDHRMYLVPNDGDPAEPGSLVSLDRIYDQLRGCPASVKIVIVDACRNDLQRGAKAAGSTPGARALAASLERRALPEGVVLLNSCAPGEISWEEEKFGHGVFMHYVLEGLDGKAEADGDGAVSLDELAKYAARETKSFVLNERSVTQRPYMRNEGEADLLDFAIVPVARLAAGAALASVQPSPAAPRPVPVPKGQAGIVENAIGMRLVRIEKGHFEMGSDEFDTEKPIHAVTITRPFLMGQTEVTQGQFEKVMGTAPWRGKRDVLEGANVAASHVNWDDAQEFCRKLTDMERRAGRLPEGRVYRLPTEAEWEYACRAGTRTKWWFGDDAARLVEHAWCKENTTARGEPYAHEVGLKPANPWSLHDMHGNVFEWCSDWYDKATYATGPEADPRGPSAAGRFRMNRGGAWGVGFIESRSAFRGFVSPANRGPGLGFRVVCEME